MRAWERGSLGSPSGVPLCRLGHFRGSLGLLLAVGRGRDSDHQRGLSNSSSGDLNLGLARLFPEAPRPDGDSW